jgi:hypothetical protein
MFFFSFFKSVPYTYCIKKEVEFVTTLTSYSAAHEAQELIEYTI